MPAIEERAGLLADIVENPGDDVPRLVFADWLADNGDDERAEFIRVQIEHAAMERAAMPEAVRCMCLGSGRCRVCQLCSRQYDLLHSFQSPPPEYPRPAGTRVHARYAWAGVVANLDDPHETAWKFRRGFVSEIRCTLTDWLEQGKAICAAQPIERVECPDRETNGAGKGGRWWSRADFDNSLGPSWWLPQSLFVLLPYNSETTAYPSTNRHYLTEEAARDALSVACIKWARS